MRICIAFAMALVLAAGQSASAALIFRFETVAPLLLGVAQFDQGTSNVVNLYLDGTGVDATALSTDGLISANLGDPTTFTPLGVTLAGVGALTAATPNNLFDDSSTIGAVDVTNQLAAWTAAVDLFSPAVFGSFNGPDYSVLLGSFTVDAGLVVGTGSLTITPTVGGDFTLGDGTPIAVPVSSFNFAVTAVPEPTSTALLGMAIVIGIVSRYGRRPFKVVA